MANPIPTMRGAYLTEFFFSFLAPRPLPPFSWAHGVDIRSSPQLCGAEDSWSLTSACWCTASGDRSSHDTHDNP
jgi:hypothetical protein